MSEKSKGGHVHLLGGVGLVLVTAAIVGAASLRDPASLAALEGVPPVAASGEGAPANGIAGEPSQSNEPPLTQADLDAAVSASSLEQLSQRYPNDVRVWRKLVGAYGNEEKTAAPALKALRHVLDLEPASATEPAFQQLVMYAASLPSVADSAFDTMRDMGSSGADVLYEIATSATLPQPARDRAWTMLREDPAIVSKESPALKIAIELKKVEPCARKPLLPAAEKDGDKRSLPYLKAPPATKGCGLFGLGSCGDCFGDHAELNRAIIAINTREKQGAH